MFAGLIFAAGGFIEALVGLRFIFRLLGANPNNAFVEWIYSWSTPFVAPFAGIFGQNATITGKGIVTVSVFDWSALVAFVIIGIIVGIIGRLLMPRHAV